MALAEFTVPGTPISKARPRTGANNNTFTPKRTRDHEKLVATYARASMRAGERAYEGLVGVALEFWTTNVKTDVDNLAKTVLDGMNGVVYADDVQVVELFVRVHRGNPKSDLRTQVLVWLLDETGD